jgi:hypothetical protein
LYSDSDTVRIKGSCNRLTTRPAEPFQRGCPALLSHTLRCLLTESQTIVHLTFLSTLPRSLYRSTSTDAVEILDLVIRPAALIISVHMSHWLQHAVGWSGSRLMSAEQTNTARAYDKWTRGAASHFKRDEERFLLMYFGRSIHQYHASRSKAATPSGEMESKTCLRGECFLHTDWSWRTWIRASTKSLTTCCGWLHERVLTCQERRCAFEFVGWESRRGLKSFLFHDSSLEAGSGCLDLTNARVISAGLGGSVPYESTRRGSRVYDTVMRASES